MRDGLLAAGRLLLVSLHLRRGVAMSAAIVDPFDEALFAPDAAEPITNRAAYYARCGLRVFPVDMRVNSDGKRPKAPAKRYLWKARATTRMAEVVDDFMAAVDDWGEDGVGIAWALGLDGYFALDLDVPDEPHWWAEAAESAAINTTAKGHHLVCRNPDGLIPSNSTSNFPTAGWGEARGHGGYIVIAGPDRPGLDAADLLEIGRFAHPEWLTAEGVIADAVSPEAVQTFEAERSETLHAAALNGVRTFLTDWKPGALRPNGEPYKASRHDTTIDTACWIAREAAAGMYPAVDGFDALREWWKTVMVNEPKRITNRELPSIIEWAIGQANANPQRIAELRANLHDDGEVERFDLDEEFWTALPFLDHVRTAARSRRTAPTAVLGSVLARASALIPPSTCVPPFVGGTVPLSLIVALVATTGGSKSATDRVAADILPNTPPGVGGPFALGSGEGAAEAYLERYTAKDDNGKNVNRQRQVKYGVIFTLDEGRVLTDLGSRSGSTIVPTLCTMWTGGDPGRMNASAETRRTLPVGGYTFGLVSLWQPSRMEGLFDDTDGGLPGRFLFLGITDPDVPETRPEFPGPLDWKLPSWIASENVTRPTPMRYPESVHAEVDAASLARLRGEGGQALDAHRNLNRLKIAGTLAVLDGSHTEVSELHWKLAGDLLKYSDRIRANVLAELNIARRQREEAGNSQAGRREVAKVTAINDTAMKSAVRAIMRKAQREAPRAVTKRELTQAIKGSDRKIAGSDDAIEEAERLGYIVATAEGFAAGELRAAA
jgi:hypothetical protein